MVLLLRFTLGTLALGRSFRKSGFFQRMEGGLEIWKVLELGIQREERKEGS